MTKQTPDIEGVVEVVNDLAKKLNLREETVSGVDEIGMVRNAILKLLQSQADEYEREKGEMVREVVEEIHKELTTPICMVDSGVCTDKITYQAVSHTIKAIALSHGIDLLKVDSKN